MSGRRFGRIAPARHARDLPRRGCFMLSLAAALAFAPAAASQGQSPKGTVTGVVRDSLGGLLSGAEIRLDGSSLRSLSDERGRYRLTGVPAGAVQVTVRRLGYRPAALDLVVSGSNETRLDVELSAVALQLAPVTVSERREVYDSRLAGFNARMGRHAGYFITRERIEQSRLNRFTDLLRSVAGVRVTSTSGIGVRRVRIRGSNCPPLVFIDGFPATAGEFDLDMIEPNSVEGVEVYGGSTSVPAELMGPRDLDRCGVIAIWSRPARPRAARPEEPKRGADAQRSDLGELVAKHAAFTADQVDRQATLDEKTAIPAYPDSLWQRKVSGRAVLEFVVDTSGVVEMKTVGIVSATSAAFGEAARDALRGARFTSAVREGVRVRQVVLLPFEFDPKRVRYVPPDTTLGRGAPLADR